MDDKAAFDEAMSDMGFEIAAGAYLPLRMSDEAYEALCKSIDVAVQDACAPDDEPKKGKK